jgi:hypothetical protein
LIQQLTKEDKIMAYTDYLRFDSNSIKDLIVNKLNFDGTYSDQLFPGSDLSVLIDVFCYMFDTMAFLENVGAAEAIFTDAQYYENMNRIVKMLGYNPMGFITSFVNCQLSIAEGEVFDPGNTETSQLILLPKFTTYTTDLNDSKGRPVKYTLTENFSTVVTSTSEIFNDNTPIFHNGTWKTYTTVFVSTGIPFETFTLSDIDASLDQKQLISHDHIKIYVEETIGGEQVWTEWYANNNLFTSSEQTFNDLTSSANKANNENRFFEYRLNENKQYTLTFGDNINGKQLPPNAKILVIYLESNGVEGEIGPGVINTDGILTVEIEGLSSEFIKNNLLTEPGIITWGPGGKIELVRAENNESSYNSRDLETTDKIRENAPKAFRTGARLITEADFEYYIKSKFTNIFDIKVMNNWSYMTEFQMWLKQYDKLKPDIKHFNYEYADSCDFNNIYLWLKAPGGFKVSESYKKIIERECDRLKPATSEIIPIDTFTTIFSPFLKGLYALESWDPNQENKIVLTREVNTMVSVERIQQKATQIILDFFKLENQCLGNTININNLYNQLMGIDGVKKVQTRYLKTGDPESQSEFYDGLSFGFWTPRIIEGADFKRITGNYKIKNFQFPSLFNPNDLSKLIVVKSDIYNISNIEF